MRARVEEQQHGLTRLNPSVGIRWAEPSLSRRRHPISQIDLDRVRTLIMEQTWFRTIDMRRWRSISVGQFAIGRGGNPVSVIQVTCRSHRFVEARRRAYGGSIEMAA